MKVTLLNHTTGFCLISSKDPVVRTKGHNWVFFKTDLHLKGEASSTVTFGPFWGGGCRYPHPLPGKIPVAISKCFQPLLLPPAVFWDLCVSMRTVGNQLWRPHCQFTLVKMLAPAPGTDWRISLGCWHRWVPGQVSALYKKSAANSIYSFRL